MTPADIEIPITTRAWPLYRALVGLGLICALIIVSAYQLTAPVIERSKTAMLEQAIFTLLPTALSKHAYRLTAQNRFEPATDKRNSARLIYAGYDAAHRLVGFAVPARGMGYQDSIELLYAYGPEQQAIIGLQVLSSRETPGLGARIASDPAFLHNFARLDVTLTPGLHLAHPIEAVPAGKKLAAWQIDSLSGATVSSRAVAAILRQSSEFWLPLLTTRQEDFTRGAPHRDLADG